MKTEIDMLHGSLGDNVKLISPEDVVERFKSEIRAMNKLYK